MSTKLRVPNPNYNKNMTTGHNVELKLNLKNHKLQHPQNKEVKSFIMFIVCRDVRGHWWLGRPKSSQVTVSISLGRIFVSSVHLLIHQTFQYLNFFQTLVFLNTYWHCCQCCWLLLHQNASIYIDELAHSSSRGTHAVQCSDTRHLIQLSWQQWCRFIAEQCMLHIISTRLWDFF